MVLGNWLHPKLGRRTEMLYVKLHDPSWSLIWNWILETKMSVLYGRYSHSPVTSRKTLIFFSWLILLCPSCVHPVKCFRECRRHPGGVSCSWVAACSQKTWSLMCFHILFPFPNIVWMKINSRTFLSFFYGVPSDLSEERFAYLELYDAGMSLPQTDWEPLHTAISIYLLLVFPVPIPRLRWRSTSP